MEDCSCKNTWKSSYGLTQKDPGDTLLSEEQDAEVYSCYPLYKKERRKNIMHNIMQYYALACICIKIQWKDY